MQEPNTLRPAKELRAEVEKRVSDMAKRVHDESLILVTQSIIKAAERNVFTAEVRYHVPESVIATLAEHGYTVVVENYPEGASVVTISW